MTQIVITAAKRTAIGSFLGQFNGVPATTLGAAAIAAAVEQSQLPAAQVDEVIMGCVLPANLGQAPARQAAIAAGLPLSAGATTINKVCGSGMKAIMLGADLIAAGSAKVVVAGGMESMSNAPHMLPNSRSGNRYGNFQAVDHMAFDGLTNAYDGQPMGVFGEDCVSKYGFSREDQDAYTIETVKRAQAALESGVLGLRQRCGQQQCQRQCPQPSPGCAADRPRRAGCGPPAAGGGIGVRDRSRRTHAANHLSAGRFR